MSKPPLPPLPTWPEPGSIWRGGYYVTKDRSLAYACTIIVAALQVWHDGVTIEPADGGR